MAKLTNAYTDGHQKNYNVIQPNNIDQLNVQNYPGFLNAKMGD